MKNSVELADKYKNRLRKIVIEFFNNFANETKIKDIESIDTSQLISRIYTRLDNLERELENSQYLDVLNILFKESGDNIIDILPAGSFLSNYRFNILYENTFNVYSQYQMKSIKELANQTINAVKNAINRAFRNQQSKEEIFDTYKEVLGMNEQQENAYNNYKIFLLSNNKEALEVKTRNPQNDKMIAAAIAGNYILSKDKINRIMHDYAINSKKYRADLIAETATQTVSSMGEFESIIQAGMIQAIDLDNLMKFWVTQQDERVRSTHRLIPSMNPDGVKILDYFRTPLGGLRYPRDPSGIAQNTINCRCYLVYKLANIENS